MLRFDAVVIGAGPAGCCLALRLAELGHAVALIERRAFPRPHVGIALSQGVAPLLDHLGLGHIPRSVPNRHFAGRLVDWADGGRRLRAEDARSQSITVDRGAFDAALAVAARARGVTVFQPAHIQGIERTPTGWTVLIEAAAGTRRLGARLLADAAGRTGVLPRRRRRIGPPLLALHAQFQGNDPDELPELVAGPDGWCWTSPLPDGQRLAIAFLDPADAGGRTPADRFRHQMDASALAGKAAVAGQRDRVTAVDASAWFDDNCIGGGFLKIGDAALATDPISAAGVQRSMQSALAGTAVANTILSRPESIELAEDFHRRSQAATVRSHAAYTMEAYGEVKRFSDRPFWQRRDQPTERRVSRAVRPPSPGTLLCRSAAADITVVPSVVGDFIEPHAALRHPALPGPVCFLANQAIVPLLNAVPSVASCAEIVACLAALVGPISGARILEWLLTSGIMEVAPMEGSRGRHPLR